ncbi:MAG: hypothetical protein CL910_10110 [Deltaproteobacteria bacterium]|jgi:Mg-chelatase subunit ChlD|nr:hypothetical protein [Deltaproteobacteria bacterium]
MTDPRPRRFHRTHQLALVLLLAVVTFAVAQAWARRSAAPPILPVPIVHPGPEPTPTPVVPIGEAKIEVAFVLDTTGSMSGLIEGAKQKIWSIANQMASSQQKASLRVALIGYRDRGDAYVTRRFDLTEDIDSIYGHLRAFGAGGGGDTPESVNQALREAVNDLSWSEDEDVYKVVFLVGDAPPHLDYPQDVQYQATARLAKQKDIVLNTIQCGSHPGTTPIWREIAGIGLGQYAAIAQDGGMVAMAAPMDEELATLNRELAATVVVYGGEEEKRRMAQKVKNSVDADAPAAASRLSYLSKVGGSVMSGMSDLVDAVKDGLELDSLDAEVLPKPMRIMSPAEQKAYVGQKLEERGRIQTRIDELSGKRDLWVKAETERLRAEGHDDGFDGRVFETIKEQAAKKGIVYE